MEAGRVVDVQDPVDLGCRGAGGTGAHHPQGGRHTPGRQGDVALALPEFRGEQVDPEPVDHRRAALGIPRLEALPAHVRDHLTGMHPVRTASPGAAGRT